MARANLEGTPNLRDALRYARELGIEIAPRRHGELKLTDPVSGDHAVVSSQRRSTSRAVLRLLRDVEARVIQEHEEHRGDDHTDPGMDPGPEGPASP